MRCIFEYACCVGVVMADGTMTSMDFEAGQILDVSDVRPAAADGAYGCDISLTDGTVLLDVPESVFTLVSECIPV